MSLTPHQRQEIVDERIKGVPVRSVAQRVGCSHTTVVKVFREWLDETSEDRSAELEALRETLVMRHEQAAFVAKASGEQARQEGDRVSHVRYLREERDSLREVARLTGSDLPVRVQVSGQVDVNVREDRDRLADYVAELCQSLN